MSEEENALDSKSSIKKSKVQKLQSARLKLALLEAELTQDQLAEKVSRSSSTISKWVSGDNTVPADAYGKLAQALGRDQYFLLADHSDVFSKTTRRMEKVVLAMIDSMTFEQIQRLMEFGFQIINNQNPDQMDVEIDDE